MKLFQATKIGFKNLKARRKSAIITILVIALSVTLSLAGYTGYKVINRFVENNIKKEISYRSAFITYKFNDYNSNTIDKRILDIPHVVKVVSEDEYKTSVIVEEFKNTNVNGSITINGGNVETFPKVVFGKTIDNTEENLLICPVNILASSDGFEGTNLKREDYIKGNDYLNKMIKLSYFSYDHSTDIPTRSKEYNPDFKIVGLYDPYTSFTDDNVCYAYFNKVEEINVIKKGNLDKYDDGLSFPSPRIIVDSADNFDEVERKLNDLNYNVKRLTVIDTNFLNMMVLCLFILIIITIVISLSNVVIFTNKMLKDSTQEIGILKAMGYKNRDILLLKVTETTIISLLGMLIGIVIYSCIFGFFYILTNYGKLMWSRFVVEFQWQAILIALIVLLIIVLFNMVSLLKKIKKIEPVRIIKD